MDILQAIILGIVEGLTEFLPVSSTGHLIVVGDWLGLANTDANKAFDVIIQLAAILAVLANYRDKISLRHLELWKKLVLAFIPIGIIGLLFHHQIKELFSVTVVAVMFIVGGVVFLVLEHFYKEEQSHTVNVEDVTYRQAFWIGIAQIFAVIPGTSRAGSTIVGGLLCGLSRRACAEFSFLLALPVMAAASGFDLLRHYQDFSDANLISLAVGFVTAFVVAYFTMKWFIHFLQRFTFVSFGIYRIVFGVMLLVFYHSSVVTG
ncbi:undecaprenol kinase [Alcanivorax hongdengensis A-11-3]|uniref:Undecaprenyl-diphosphatase n=1 Tax=Alcanivorax hongdengensis A-11-3 TaxID=1177179 RepID=L0WDT7_9GAMM|nr:undecaprenyl-diphosphate phosphatase [Alcanivorax hongdengensis]EKF75211.1 undecaprenol kinase [Alcanivorax hongdengensis A-11-3]